MATTLSLGDVDFADLEIPEHITFGGEQRMAVHELVGGTRIIDAMGRSDMPLEWSGYFMGEDALSRARDLEAKRIAGASLVLSWSEFSYDVLIQRFEADFQREWLMPYRISCAVIGNHAQPQTSQDGSSIDNAIAGDLSTANSLTSQIGDSTLSGLMNTVNSAISSVSTFANAAKSTINSVLQPINAVQQQVSTLIGQAANTMINVTTLGGILPNNPISQTVANLAHQVTAYQQSSLLYNLQSVMGRMSTNLGGVTGAVQQITTAGGNLFDMAAKVYGKAEAWTGIAKANGLNDPSVQGVQTLDIPVTPDNSGGVMTA